jgi:hypothetical protein
MGADATYQLGQLGDYEAAISHSESWLRRNEEVAAWPGRKPGIAMRSGARECALARRSLRPGLDEALKIFRETGIRGLENPRY